MRVLFLLVFNFSLFQPSDFCPPALFSPLKPLQIAFIPCLRILHPLLTCSSVDHNPSLPCNQTDFQSAHENLKISYRIQTKPLIGICRELGEIY